MILASLLWVFSCQDKGIPAQPPAANRRPAKAKAKARDRRHQVAESVLQLKVSLCKAKAKARKVRRRAYPRGKLCCRRRKRVPPPQTWRRHPLDAEYIGCSRFMRSLTA